MNLDEFAVDGSEGGSTGLTTNTLTRESSQWRAAVYSRLGTASKIVSEIQSLEMVKFTEIDRRLRRMEALLKSISESPARAIGSQRTDRGTVIRVGDVLQGGDTRPATLSRNPKMLSTLWDEYINGVCGRKPAKQFTWEERGLGVLSRTITFENPSGFVCKGSLTRATRKQLH